MFKTSIQKFLIESLLWVQLLIFISVLIFITLIFIGKLQIDTDKFIAISIGILSSLYTVNNSYYHNKKIMKELFDDFNKRYDKLNDDLNDLVRLKLNAVSELICEEQRKKYERSMDDYLNLCSEEFFWFKRGLIESEGWNNWYYGIKYFLDKPIFQSKIKSEKEVGNINSYYGFLTYYQKKSK